MPFFRFLNIDDMFSNLMSVNSTEKDRPNLIQSRLNQFTTTCITPASYLIIVNLFSYLFNWEYYHYVGLLWGLVIINMKYLTQCLTSRGYSINSNYYCYFIDLLSFSHFPQHFEKYKNQLIEWLLTVTCSHITLIFES